MAAFATHSAAFSHVGAGGTTPHAVAVIISLFFSVLLCTVLLRRNSGIATMSAAIGLSQFVFHGLFEFFGVAGTASSITTSGHHGHLMAFSATGGQADAASLDVAMVMAHVLAAAASVGVARLAQGTWSRLQVQTRLVVDRVIDRIGTVIRSAAPLPAPTRPAPSTRHLLGHVEHPLLHERVRTSGFLRHRGPPPAAFA